MSEKDSAWEYKRREKRPGRIHMIHLPQAKPSGPLDVFVKPHKKRNMLFAN